MAETNSKSTNFKPSVKYEKKLSSILKAASKIIARDGFKGASIRNVAAKGNIALSGIYYYFKGKDELLYAIQHHTFSTLVDSLNARINKVKTPKQKLRAAIDNHLSFYINNMDDLKVCVHEIESLSGKYYREVLEIRKQYYQIVRDIIDELYTGSSYEKDLTTLYIFGSLNWIYMWYDPEVNSDIEKLSSQFFKLIMNGIKSS